MFNNIGRKIKTLASILTWIGIVVYAILGIAIAIMVAANDSSMLPVGIAAGILVAAIGGVAAWISSFLLYGFGQLIENSDKIIQTMDVE